MTDPKAAQGAVSGAKAQHPAANGTGGATTSLVAAPKRTRMIARRDVAVRVELSEEERKEHLELYGKILPQTRIVKAGEEFECTEAEASEFEKPFAGYFNGTGHLHKFQMEVSNERLVRAERLVAEGRKAS